MAGIRWRYIILVFLGIWIALLPVLGFPRSLKNWLFVITGLLVVFFSYYAYVGSFARLQKGMARASTTHEQTRIE